ncbi:MAG: hypothetical protein GXO48_00215 [Chlorobi bacterium]|nr:hypothetical protein [Chlorobiota bacterium]
MKKLVAFGGIALLIGLTTSCKRTFVCSCRLMDQNGQMLEYREFLIKETKKKAEQACLKISGVQDEAGNVWGCELK